MDRFARRMNLTFLKAKPTSLSNDRNPSTVQPDKAPKTFNILQLLPAEILLVIAELLRGQDLKNLRLASHVCRDIATPRLFSYKLKLSLEVWEGYHFCCLHGWYEYEGKAVSCHAILKKSKKHCSFSGERALEVDGPLIGSVRRCLANGLRDLLPQARVLTLRLDPITPQFDSISPKVKFIAGGVSVSTDIDRFTTHIFSILESTINLRALHVYARTDIDAELRRMPEFLMMICEVSSRMKLDLHLNLTTLYAPPSHGLNNHLSQLANIIWGVSSFTYAQQGSACSRYGTASAYKVMEQLLPKICKRSPKLILENPNDMWDLVDDSVPGFTYVIKLGMENRNKCDR